MSKAENEVVPEKCACSHGIEISVVIPCCNEAGNVTPLADQICCALEPLGRSFEIIFVDDGSKDDTYRKVKELAANRPMVRFVRHRQNFGQSAAVLSGLEVSRGDIIITMDADLQNDPSDIPHMLDLLRGADAVCGVRTRRVDSSVKLATSWIANKVRGAILGDGVQDAGCGFRVIRKQALRQLPGFRAQHRFATTLLRIKGYRVIETPIKHRPRLTGRSKYGVNNRFWVGIIDILGMLWYKKRFIPPCRLEGEIPHGEKAETRSEGVQ